jgi:phosphatidylinositol 4-kinase
MVELMLGSGLPCFKPNTMKNLRDRFRLDLDDDAAAVFMQKLIQSSHKALSTVVYDGFQKLTNGKLLLQWVVLLIVVGIPF